MLGLTTYEIISIVLAVVTILFAAISVIIAIWSSRQTTKEVNRLINDTNRATRANISVEINKLTVERFRLSMQILDLQAQKKHIEHEPRRTFYMAGGDGVDAQIKLIDEQIDHCERLDRQMGLMQIEMGKILDNFK
jgi:cell division protein FtsL